MGISKIKCRGIGCNKTWDSVAAYNADQTCNSSTCLQKMAKNPKPPALLMTPKEPPNNVIPIVQAPIKHAEYCLCPRCMDEDRKMREEAEEELARLMAAGRASERAKREDLNNILLEEDDDWRFGWDVRAARNYGRQHMAQRAKPNDLDNVVMKYPAPRQVKMRVNKRECAVNSNYDPAVDALMVKVPLAITVSIFPRGSGK